MHHFSQKVAFKATEDWNNHTAHALLVTAFNKAQSVGLFTRIDDQLKMKMKKRTYSWSDKLATLWASVVVGCNHTFEINDKLGSHEKAAATMFGLNRFPDQSQINRLLWAFKDEHVCQMQKETKEDYYLTDLDSDQLRVERVLEVYNDRPTIERYFYDEQYGLGARQVRTGHFAGEAMFEFIVATTNNLLRWMKQSTFRGTELEKIGLSRLIHQAMQIPGRIKRCGRKWVVEMPAQHHLVKQLMRSWKELKPAAVDT